MKPVGDARRRLELERAAAAGDAWRLRRELEGLHATLAEMRTKRRAERCWHSEQWTNARLPHVARELAAAEARAARLEDELAGR